MRAWGSCLISCLAIASTAHAETFTYDCKVRGRSSILNIDDTSHSLSWRGKTFKTKELGQDSCARYGLRATRPGQSFDFCTATKGYADFVDNGSPVQCNQVAVTDEYLGRWAPVPEKNEAAACKDDPVGAVVTTDQILTSGEDYCRLIAVKEINGPNDPRLEITCMADGEGTPEVKQRETWRLREMLGKKVFIEQTPGGLAFWQRCP